MMNFTVDLTLGTVSAKSNLKQTSRGMLFLSLYLLGLISTNQTIHTCWVSQLTILVQWLTVTSKQALSELSSEEERMINKSQQKHRIVSSTFQIAQFLVQSHSELISSVLALEATEPLAEPVAEPVAELAVELISNHLISVHQKR